MEKNTTKHRKFVKLSDKQNKQPTTKLPIAGEKTNPPNAVPTQQANTKPTRRLRYLKEQKNVLSILTFIFGIITFVATEILFFAYLFIEINNKFAKSASVIYWMSIIAAAAASFTGFVLIVHAVMKLISCKERDDDYTGIVDIIIGCFGIFATVWLFVSLKDPAESYYTKNLAVFISAGWAITLKCVLNRTRNLGNYLFGALILIKVWLAAINYPNYSSQYVSSLFGQNMMAISVAACIVFGAISIPSHLLLEDNRHTAKVLCIVFNTILIMYAIIAIFLLKSTQSQIGQILIAWSMIAPAGLAYGFGYYA